MARMCHALPLLQEQGDNKGVLPTVCGRARPHASGELSGRLCTWLFLIVWTWTGGRLAVTACGERSGGLGAERETDFFIHSQKYTRTHMFLCCSAAFCEKVGREPPASIGPELDADLTRCLRAVELEYLLSRGAGWDQVGCWGGRVRTHSICACRFLQDYLGAISSAWPRHTCCTQSVQIHTP